jgi:hypothetical protein
VVRGLVQFRRLEKAQVQYYIGLVVGGLIQLEDWKKRLEKVYWSGGRQSCSIYNTRKSAVAK